MVRVVTREEEAAGRGAAGGRPPPAVLPIVEPGDADRLAPLDCTAGPLVMSRAAPGLRKACTGEWAPWWAVGGRPEAPSLRIGRPSVGYSKPIGSLERAGNSQPARPPSWPGRPQGHRCITDLSSLTDDDQHKLRPETCLASVQGFEASFAFGAELSTLVAADLLIVPYRNPAWYLRHLQAFRRRSGCPHHNDLLSRFSAPRAQPLAHIP